MIDIEVKQGEQYADDISAFIKFKYNPRYVNLMRSLPTRFWHPDKLQWEIPYSDLDLVINKLSESEYKIKTDKEAFVEPTSVLIPKDFQFKTKPFQHQIEGVEYGLNHNKFLLGDEQGCIDGSMIVSYSINGTSKKDTLANVYSKYQKSNKKNQFKVRCLKDGVFGLNDVLDILYSGDKAVYKVTLANGEYVNATADHEILTDSGYKAVEALTVDDEVLTNGEILSCKCCGNTENLITYKNAKFYGYCRSCMYANRDGTKYKGDEIGKHIGHDGYVYMFGKPLRTHSRYTKGGLPEHIYIMEQIIGRPLSDDEEVHHINGIKHDNRKENLQLVTRSEHMKIHHAETHFHKDFKHHSGSTVIMIPKKSKVVSVEYVGVVPTYDIKMASPYHNFIANHVVVHNCGKALSLNTKVYTPDGYKIIKDIQPGEYVFNKQGKPVKVLDIYDNPQSEMCKITFSDGNIVECCIDHLWEINTRVGKQVVDTKWFFFELDTQEAVVKDSSGYLYSIDMCEPVEFTPQVIPMNPYYYGRNIDVKSNVSFISNEYKYNCSEVRYEVAKGLVERSCQLHCTNNRQVINLTCQVVSKQLCDDIQYLFESLGCVVTVEEVTDSNKLEYEIAIQTNDYSKLLEDKSISQSYKDTVRYITKIERIEKADAKCITVDDESGLYLIDHFIVTHNTKQMIDLACIKKQLYGYEHCLVIACVNGLKYNWQAEIGIHSDETGYILGTTINRKGVASIGSNEKRLKDLQNIDNIDSYFLITNIETLRYNIREKVPCKAKRNGQTRYKTVTRFPIVEEIQKLVREKKIGMIVVDEIHRCLCADTPVLTDKGLVSLAKITKEKCYKVATRSDGGSVDYVYPTNYFINPIPGIAMELTIETEQGIKTIICTVNHKFLTSNRGYVEAQDLTADDDIVEV